MKDSLCKEIHSSRVPLGRSSCLDLEATLVAVGIKEAKLRTMPSYLSLSPDHNSIPSLLINSSPPGWGEKPPHTRVGWVDNPRLSLLLKKTDDMRLRESVSLIRR